MAEEAFGSVLSTYSEMLFTCLRISFFFFLSLFISFQRRTRFTDAHIWSANVFIFRVQNEYPVRVSERMHRNKKGNTPAQNEFFMCMNSLMRYVHGWAMPGGERTQWSQ